jgi:hypothetical protein
VTGELADAILQMANGVISAAIAKAPKRVRRTTDVEETSA